MDKILYDISENWADWGDCNHPLGVLSLLPGEDIKEVVDKIFPERGGRLMVSKREEPIQDLRTHPVKYTKNGGKEEVYSIPLD
jgi:hypothetical protein